MSRVFFLLHRELDGRPDPVEMVKEFPISPAAAAKSTSERPNGNWRPRLKEHQDVCEREMMEKSAVAEHVWEHHHMHHPIHWEETTVLDHGRGQELLVKEALHIQMTPVEERFNRDGGLEVPGCWTTVMRRQGGRSNPHRPLTSNDVYILGSAWL